MIKQLRILLTATVIVSSTFFAANIVQAAEVPFIGEVRWFGGNFAPRGWALCNGQELPIAQNTALFSLLGTTYGGDGETVFNLPDLRGRAYIHEGNGADLTSRTLGEKGGSETESIASENMSDHSHTLMANSTGGNSASPVGNVVSKAGRLRSFDPPPADTQMANSAISAAGGSQPHNNMQPFVTINCIIATQGVFPSE